MMKNGLAIINTKTLFLLFEVRHPFEVTLFYGTRTVPTLFLHIAFLKNNLVDPLKRSEVKT